MRFDHTFSVNRSLKHVDPQEVLQGGQGRIRTVWQKDSDWLAWVMMIEQAMWVLLWVEISPSLQVLFSGGLMLAGVWVLWGFWAV
jgi:hypothetical protein